MAIIAVAGATGRVGKTIIDVLLEQGKHTVVPLARKVDTQVQRPSNVTINYDDVAGTAELLAINNVDTVISAISVLDGAASVSQVHLVEAADRSGPTKRFIASDWGVPHSKESPVFGFREAAFNALRNTHLEWTRFNCGYFLDFYALPYLKSHFTQLDWVVDMTNNFAAVPGSGDDIITLTYSYDLGKFVAAALELPKWDEISYCFGDKTTWNKFVSAAKGAKGLKFTVVHDSADQLHKGEVTELPSHSNVYTVLPKQVLQMLFSLFGRYVIEGRLNIPEDKALNRKVLGITTMKVDYIMSLWKGH